MRNRMRTLAVALAIVFSPLAAAQTTGGETPATGQALVAGKIASNFTGLAGGEDNALALVNALRKGTDVTLATVVPPPTGSTAPPTVTTTTFTPPTGRMGWGNVKHSLALARDALARAGVANPTAEQLQTALMGGDITVVNADGTTSTTTMKGILTMRADGMGWGNIAKEGGTKLGPITSKVDMSNKAKTTTTTGVTTAAVGTANTKSSKGITTATGATSTQGPKGLVTAGGATSTQGSKGLVTADGATAGHTPKGNAYGRGIVSGAGGGGINVGATMGGKPTTAGGAGVVTGGGNSAAGISNAGGNAGGQGKGHGNGKGKVG